MTNTNAQHVPTHSVTGNLPSWKGAAGAYGRAYRILASMADAGYVTKSYGRCFVKEEMNDIIKGLNSGDEATIKYNNLVWLRFDKGTR